jgi:hypothetical protein
MAVEQHASPWQSSMNGSMNAPSGWVRAFVTVLDIHSMRIKPEKFASTDVIKVTPFGVEKERTIRQGSAEMNMSFDGAL